MSNLTAPDRGTWISASGKVRIAYSQRVLDEIRAAAVEGLCRFPRGGVEVGGVLLGSVRDGEVQVIASRPVECSYTLGPSFTLTAGDEARFRDALAAGASNLEAVGWYHSHTRSALQFSAEDAAVHERLFPEPRRVALVVRPEPFGSAEAGFFVRGDDGAMEAVPHGAFLMRPGAASSPGGVGSRRARTHVFEPSAPTAVPVMEQDSVPEPERVTVSAAVADPLPAAPATGRQELPPEPGWPAPPVVPEWRSPPEPAGSRTGSRWVGWAAVAAAVALAAIAIWSGLHSRTVPAVAPHLALRVAEANGQLQITWDRNSPPLKMARRGFVTIRDGGQNITVPFDAARLRAGGLTYARTSQDVEIRLRVEGPVPAEESVRLFGPGVGPAAPANSAPPVAPAPKVSEPPKQPAEVNGLKLASGTTQIPSAERRIRTDETDQEARPPLRPFRPTAQPEQTQARAAALPQPPDVQSAPALGSNGIPAGVPSAGPPPQPQPQAAEEPVASVRAVPAAGRLIWVGRLDPGARLSINGQRVSSGALTGELPGVPVRISAYPAELGNGELRVFASSPRARGNREPAGPQNGWNPTIYAWDAGRASDVLVTETPSAQNGWRGMSVRGNGQPVSVIVIDWRAAQQ
ncbi:MAG TPA: Mov34/MPN/PAD-1 family protein [Bryobacteraceae bacterium]|nr:Mov34/MPN/PAD-1 family protein [Bryobacteraceae bacterium]